MYDLACLCKRFLLCYLNKKVGAFFADPVDVRGNFFPCGICCPDDLLKVHAGTALVCERLFDFFLNGV